MKFTARTCAPVIAFFPNLLRMLSAAPHCFVVSLAVQLVQSSSQHNGIDEEHSVGEGFSNHTTCSWNCSVTESDFTKQCDPVFTKKRLITFNVRYDLKVNKKCLNQTSYKSLFTDNFNIWTPANITLSSFSRGIKGVWTLVWNVSCYEEGQIKGFCHFEPRRTTILRPRDFRKEVKDSIEEMGYVVFTTQEVQSSWVSGYLVFITLLAVLCSNHLPALLCLLPPTLVMENGIRYIVLEGASPVSIRSAVGNNLFFNDCSMVKSTRCQTGKMFIFRLLLVMLLILPVALGVVVVNPYRSIFANPFQTVCVAIYSIKVFFCLLFLHTVKPEMKNCLACQQLKCNPRAQCFCRDIPRQILNHMRAQPLILAKCWSLFVRRLQRYFEIITLKGLRTRWVIRGPLSLLFLLTLPFAVILLLLASLLLQFFILCCTVPQVVFLISCSHAFLSKLYMWSLFVRLPALKRCVQLIDNFVVTLLASVGAVYLLSYGFLGILLTLLLAVIMALSFPDESPPFVACLLLFCYYLISSYSSLSNRYHDLSVAIFNCYKKQSHRISHKGLYTNVKTDPSKSKRNVIKIPKELFDMACEELKPIRETLCTLILKVAFISSFVFLVFYLTMRLHLGLKPVTKTAVAFFTGLFPKVLSKYFGGERKKRIWALAVEENAPKIVEAYLNRVLRANQGQENSGVDTDEISLRVDEDEEIVEMVNIH